MVSYFCPSCDSTKYRFLNTGLVLRFFNDVMAKMQSDDVSVTMVVASINRHTLDENKSVYRIKRLTMYRRLYVKDLN